LVSSGVIASQQMACCCWKL